MKTESEKKEARNRAKQRERAKKRASGLVPKEIWVKPQAWESIKRLIEKKNNESV